MHYFSWQSIKELLVIMVISLNLYLVLKYIEIRKQISKKISANYLHCVLMTEQLYNSIDFVLHWEKKAKERKRKKKTGRDKKGLLMHSSNTKDQQKVGFQKDL